MTQKKKKNDRGGGTSAQSEEQETQSLQEFSHMVLNTESNIKDMSLQSHSWASTYRKTYFEKIRASPMFTTVLFITGKTWKQPKRPSTEESTNNMYAHVCIYVHTHTYTYTWWTISHKKE